MTDPYKDTWTEIAGGLAFSFRVMIYSIFALVMILSGMWLLLKLAVVAWSIQG
jgi:hypothetical protein